MSRIYTRQYSRNLVLLGISFLLCACDSATIVTDSVDESLVVAAATGSDFVALRVEAENFTATSGGWTLTNHQNIPTTKPDPDPPHHQNASGSANMELLPDTRVTHNDELIAGTNYWGNPGNGPRLEYQVNLPEAGRYYVWVRAYSTGLEDNGIHVGFDNDKPDSGARIQLCSGKNKWTWSSAQRVATNHCGVAKTIYLDFQTAGTHTVKFYAREDGYEIDQFMLLKETSSALNCFPLGDAKVKCVNVATGKSAGTFDVPAHTSSGGNIVAPPPPVPVIDIDLDLDIAADGDNFMIGDLVTYTVKVKNKDNNDTATGVTAAINLPDEISFASSGDCNQSAANINCDFQEAGPKATLTATFTATVVQAGSARVDARVTADQDDGTMANNAESVSIETSPYIPQIDGELVITHAPNAMGATDTAQAIFIVKNSGRQTITGAALQLDSNPVIALNVDIADCSGLNCMLADIPAGESIEVPVTLDPVSGGLANISVNLIIANDENQDNNTLVVPRLVKDPAVVSMADNDVAIEAEDFVSQSTLTLASDGTVAGWSATASQIQSKVQPDFDQGNFTNASQESYIEYLPDTRVGSEDPATDNVSNFSAGGTSATLTYQAFFNKAGRYYVNTRLRANNAEDASVHVGLDNVWPESASSITSCSPDGTWRWTNSQLVEGLCDSTSQAYIDIETAGNHTVQISSGTDGVEVDKVIFRLDNPDLPVGLGADQTALQMVDLDIAVDTSITDDPEESSTESSSQDIYEIHVSNLDSSNTAYDITVTIEGLDAELASGISGLEDCLASDTSIECKLYVLAPDSSAVATVALGDSQSDITTTVALGQANDTDESNNSSVASAGGGAFSLWFVLFALLPAAITVRRKTALQGITPATHTRHINNL